jgi:hypothetical protein
VSLILLAAHATLLATCDGVTYASCGDWLEHDPIALGRVAVDRSTAGPLSAIGTNLKADDKGMPLVPCNGPFCRQAPPLPDAPAAPVAQWSTVEHAVLSGSSTGVSISRPDLLVNNEDARPAKGFPTRIDHPPRV